jgi:hypothetical protein
MDDQLLTTNRKALTINLSREHYGTLAEIGAGQEVARHFFQAGGAGGTIAKTMSAYDMKFSDEIYGKSPRYVSRERLMSMLDHEYGLLTERLSAERGASSRFFAFADTVATRNFAGTNEAHGWMGLRFQLAPQSEPNDIFIHVRMWDKDAVHQQEALGIAGVNLIYAAFHLRADLAKFVTSLADNVGTDRIEVDMITFSGPDFASVVDNRLLSLLLVQHGLTNAVLFGPGGGVLQPSEVLYKKAILVERGSFKPVTLVNEDMLRCACAQFTQEPEVKGRDVVVLMEITMLNLLAGGSIDHQDFLSRVDTLAATGHHVLVSNYPEFFRLTTYFRRYTGEMIGVAMGVNNLLEVFNEKYYENLPGGILESFGRLFKNAVKLYIYPMRRDAYDRYLSTGHHAAGLPSPASRYVSNVLITAKNLMVSPRLQNLYAHLLENHYLECIAGYDESILDIFSREVLRLIKEQDGTWEKMVPPPVAALIKARQLFGWTGATEQ